jgi:hypothetical protein
VNTRLFAVLAVITVAAGITLRIGIVSGSVSFLAAGAALSAISPWGVVAVRLVQRHRTTRRQP